MIKSIFRVNGFLNYWCSSLGLGIKRIIMGGWGGDGKWLQLHFFEATLRTYIVDVSNVFENPSIVISIWKINWEIRTPPPKKGKKTPPPPSSPMEWLIIIFYLAVCEQPQKFLVLLSAFQGCFACSINGTLGFFKIKKKTTILTLHNSGLVNCYKENSKCELL
jgi:hypothetical protein